MNVLSNLFEKSVQRIIQVYETNNKDQRKNIEKPPTNKLKDFIVKTIGFINSGVVGRDMEAHPEYDFEQIKLAAETDSYIKMALDKPKRLIYKAGYYLKSENAECVDYLNKRFRIMSYATGKPMDILFQEVADDLITYSNCFLVKTRVKRIMTGIKAVGIDGNLPIGGYSRIDPSTISVQRDECGNILGYIQRTIGGKEKKFKPCDIIHMYMNKESSNAFGTPKIIGAMEDVKLLRNLEGYILTIIHRFAIPIYHWKIGKTQQGFQATPREIDDAKEEIEGMSLDGVVITNEKTEISVIGSEGAAINMSQYLDYFEKRVISALDTSESQMGRGGAKQDADSMEAQSHDYVKYVQKIISVFYENFMLSELLIEGGFNPILNEEDIVEYIFNEINLETKLKLENHEMLKYQSNYQSLEESRRNIGAKENVDENRLYKNLIEVPAQIKVAKATVDAQHGADMELADKNNAFQKSVQSMQKTSNGSSSSGTSSAKTSSTKKMNNGKKPSSAPNKAVATKNRPTNQHGTTSVKVKESIDLSEKVIRNKKNHEKKYDNFYSKLKKLRNNLIETDSDIDYLFAITIDSLTQDMKTLINEASKEGIDKAINDLKVMKIDNVLIHGASIDLNFMYENAHSTIKDIFIDMKKKLNDDRDLNNVDAVLDTLKYRFRFLIEYLLPKVVWYSYLKTGKIADIKTAQVLFGDSKDKETHDEIIDIDAFSLDDIPAFHPFCDCKLKFVSNKGGE